MNAPPAAAGGRAGKNSECSSRRRGGLREGTMNAPPAAGGLREGTMNGPPAAGGGLREGTMNAPPAAGRACGKEQ